MEKAQPAYPKGLDFEQVWAAILAMGEKIDRLAEESREQIRESREQIRESREQIRKSQEQIRESREQIIRESQEQIIRESREQIIRESQEQIRESREQIIRESQEQIRETDKRYEKTRAIIEEVARQQEETSRQMKETDKRVGELTGRFGEVVEHMIVPNLVAKFRELGFEFTKAGPDVKIADKEHDIHAEIDAFLENGDKVMIVETKSKPNTDDINEHLERMEKLRKYADLKGDRRTYLGAIAGVIFGESEKTYALKKGFYVIEPSGDTFSIIEPKGKYHPREW